MVLISYLEELSLPDPRPSWQAGAEAGLVCGIDEVIQFLFDDYDFDERAIGYALFDAAEVRSMSHLTHALDQIITELPRGGEADYVAHPFWPDVTEAARQANRVIGGR